ncbi:lanthionine synthetase LanC family protein [Chitinophaga sp. RAB17]|uniref:lanthionine synthetase LanC family protein n=1 Tax=Chitinophaga sp. RAB17 TaxID=3233049 RepID=UPI003F92608C
MGYYTKDRHRKLAAEIGWQVIQQMDAQLHGAADNDALLKSMSADIYGGIAGVVLFLTELYKDAGETPFLEAAVRYSWELLDRTQSGNDNINNYSFFTGSTGICYALFRVGEVADIDSFKNAYKKLLVPLSAAESIVETRCEMLYGLSGVLYGLLVLSESTGDCNFFTPSIRNVLSGILLQTKLYAEGVFWDRKLEESKPLCGFSHGVSGVSFVLSKAATYFQYEELAAIAALGFQYEDACYDPAYMNWPDYRKLFYSKDELGYRIDNLLKEDIGWAMGGCNTFFWCHGGPGGLIARLTLQQQYPHLYSPEFLGGVYANLTEQIKIQTSPDNVNEDNTLCHGKSGLVLAAICSAPEYGSAVDIGNFVDAISENQQRSQFSEVLQQKEGRGLSLLTGIAGIGYLLLVQGKAKGYPHQIFDFNITAAEIPEPVFPMQLAADIGNHDFPISVSILKSVGFFERVRIDRYKKFQVIRKVIGFCNCSQTAGWKTWLLDAIKFELFKVNARNRISSGVLATVYAAYSRNAGKMFKALDLDEQLVLHPLVKLNSSKFRWDREWSEVDHTAAGDSNIDYFINLSAGEITANYCGDFCFTALLLVSKCMSYHDVLEELLQHHIEEPAEEARTTLESKLYDQIFELLSRGVIVYNKHFINV